MAGHGYSTNCTWLIQANDGKVINFEMMEIDTQSGQNCSLDSLFYLEVRIVFT